ncbi:MAG: phosphatase PAP2 family protein [Caldisericaceae bacterium]
MEFLKKNWKYYVINILLAVGVYYASKIYALTNHNTGNVHILQTAFDRLVPFIPQFIVVYNSLEPVLYISLLFFFVFHPRIFTAFASSMIVLFLVSNLVYVFFQTEVPRPALTQGTNWYVDKVIQLYNSDNPYNCFPSLHCGTSTLAAAFWFVKKRYRVVAYVMALWAVLIILSTQFLKQHVVVDITGSIVALLLYFAAYRVFNLKRES